MNSKAAGVAASVLFWQGGKSSQIEWDGPGGGGRDLKEGIFGK